MVRVQCALASFRAHDYWRRVVGIRGVRGAGLRGGRAIERAHRRGAQTCNSGVRILAAPTDVVGSGTANSADGDSPDAMNGPSATDAAYG